MTRDELRDKTARIIESWGTDSFDIVKDPRTYADQILALPEIKEALDYMELIRSGRFYDVEIKARLGGTCKEMS